MVGTLDGNVVVLDLTDDREIARGGQGNGSPIICAASFVRDGRILSTCLGVGRPQSSIKVG